MKQTLIDYLTEKDQCHENQQFLKKKHAKSQKRRQFKSQALMQLLDLRQHKNQICLLETQAKNI